VIKSEEFDFKTHTDRYFLAFLIKNVFKSEMCCEDFFVCLKVAPKTITLQKRKINCNIVWGLFRKTFAFFNSKNI
jgi:hypothetical protein